MAAKHADDEDAGGREDAPLLGAGASRGPAQPSEHEHEPPRVARMGSHGAAGTGECGAAAGGSAGADGTPPPGWPRTCRICFDTEERPGDGEASNPLISPCRCSGSSRWVHRACLAQWRETAHRSDAYYQCEVCHFKYMYSRAWWASVIGSRVTLVLVFTSTLIGLLAALGFIPFLDSSLAGSSGRGGKPSGGGGDSGGGGGGGASGDITSVVGKLGLHLLNGLVGLGLLGLVASAALGVARLLGHPVPFALPDPWCPAAMCLDCGSQGGGVLCLELGAGECGIALAVVLGVALLAVGITASSLMLWQALLLGARAALAGAQHMVENVAPQLDSSGGGGSSSRTAAADACPV